MSVKGANSCAPPSGFRPLSRVRYMDAKRGPPEGDKLDVLVTLIEAWEVKHSFFAYAGSRILR